MASFIDFNIEQSDNAKEFRFTETTGAYNGSSNTGGWGTPNQATSAATAAVLEVTPPDGTLVSLNLFTSNYPTTDRTIEFTIDSADLSLTADEQLEDGEWLFSYIVTTPLGTFTNNQTVYISGQARCCVYTMLCEVDACKCDNADVARALEAYTYYRMTVAAALCGNGDKFNEGLEIVHAYCDNCCSTCD